MDRIVYDSQALEAGDGARGETPGDARATLAGAAQPRIGVIYNPRSHLNKGAALAVAKRPGIMLAQPGRREDIAAALAGFAAQGIDYLMINGGDGTIRDVLTMGQTVFGDSWPEIAILPRGKTNALNVDLGAPKGWSLPQAIDAWATGKRVRRRPLTVVREDGEDPAIVGFFFGAGTFTLGVEVGQDAHNLGFFNSLAVIATGAWGIAQALFGSDRNRWRRGTPMALTLAGGRQLVHSGKGDPDRRTILLATTLETLPMGIKLFGPDRPGLKLAVLDRPSRRVLAAAPAMLAGWQPAWFEKAGFHRLDAEGFTLDIAEAVILDGEAFPAGRYRVGQGPQLTFVTP